VMQEILASVLWQTIVNAGQCEVHSRM
jgi:hypothetical protein